MVSRGSNCVVGIVLIYLDLFVQGDKVMNLAHISEDLCREQSVQAHLVNTAQLAKQFADAFGCGEWGYGCGLLHDIGKYSIRFQERIRGKAVFVDHSTAGAKELYKRKNLIGAYCIAGHHSGLPDGGMATADANSLTGRMNKEIEEYQQFEQEIEIPKFSNPPLQVLGIGGFTKAFFTRMLFSCLVDADYLDTESFMTDGTMQRGGYDSMEVLLSRLQKHIEPWLHNTDYYTINGRRTAILKACMEKGIHSQGLYQLTVPTGGGKTIASLAFALVHAVEHHLDHVIYVIPYTSIIEQTAQIFRDILGNVNVLEDHCNINCESEWELKRQQLASENWDSPITITTNVQFFESLFSNKTSKCRKLHNISNSVIIFDEAQMLPIPYLKPCIQAISELTYNYHSTAVVCTATQPNLQSLFPEELKLQELCPDVKEQFHFFKRTAIHRQGVMNQEELINSLKQRTQVLCILNSRKCVQQIYESLPDEGRYHLSTFMYPKHRKRILSDIKRIVDSRQESKKICRVVATSLVEAGVDFDFETVFRELAGIDSIIQAAGRCNREGRRDISRSETIVFTMEHSKDAGIPLQLKLPISIAEKVSQEFEDLSSPEAIEAYFTQLFYYKGQLGLDYKNIVEQFEKEVRTWNFPFASVSKIFKLIEQNTRTILIPIEIEAEEIVDRIRRGECSRQLVREAGQYCVNVYENDFQALHGAGYLEALPLDFFLLTKLELYTEESGLAMKVERGEALFY